MKSKENKLPAVFRKPVSKKVWDKKFIGKIYLPEDRKFLEAHLLEDEDQLRISAEDLSGKDLKRLKELGKVIKANRKSVSIVLLVVLAVLSAGIICWQFFLKDAVVSRFVENNLEKVFQAEVDVEGTDLSLFRGLLQFDNIVIADANCPMKNLVELEGVKAEIDITRLLKGHIRIKELGFAGLKRGTDRTVSGALSEFEAGETVDAAADPVEASGNLIDDTAAAISALIGEIDVEELLEQQKGNLKSFTLIEGATSDVTIWSEQWGEVAGDWEGKITEWESTVAYVSGINPGSFSSISSAGATITELQGVYAQAERDYETITQSVSDAQQQIDKAASMIEDVRKAVDEDMKWVESLVSLPEEGQTDWAASIIEEQLGVPVLKYLNYFRRGTAFYERFSSVMAKRKAEKTVPRRPGRSLVFSTEEEPFFLLEHAFASGTEEVLDYEVDLWNVSDKSAAPEDGPRLSLGWNTGATGTGEAELSLQGGALSLSAIPFELGEGLESFSIENLSGDLALDSKIRIQGETVSGILDFTADGINISETNSDDFLFRLVQRSLNEVVPLSVAGIFSWSEDDGLSLSAETELDKQLGDAVGAILEESAGEGIKLIKDYLDTELTGPLADLEAVTGDLSEYVEIIETYGTDFESYQNLAEDKIAEIKASAAEAAEAEVRNQIENQLGEETTEQIEDAIDDVKEGIGGLLNF